MALIVVMFVAGLSATGIVHQAGWLIASRRSLVEKKITEFRYGWGSPAHHLKQIGMGSVMLSMAPESPGRICRATAWPAPGEPEWGDEPRWRR